VTGVQTCALPIFNFRTDAARESLNGGYAVTASHDPAGAAAVSDRDVGTAWRLPAPLPAAWIRFDFSKPERVDRIALLPPDQGQIPARLAVQISDDGAQWRTVEEFPAVSVYFWSVRHPFLKLVKPRCELALPRAQPSRHLRILVPAQPGSCAISEAYLYRRDAGAAPVATVDQEVDAIARALAPLKPTHRIAGDHYFMSLLRLAGFDVEFIPNRAVNNSGRRNPFLTAHLPLDFSRPLALIVPKAHAPSVAARLDEAGVRHQRREFAFDELFVTSPATTSARLYWSGLDLLRTADAPGRRR
jgi:hypothetical protein